MYAQSSSSHHSPGAQNALIDSFSCGPRRSNAEPIPPGSRVTPPRQDLVRIRLVADVPQDLVVRRVKQRVQRDRQLARSQVRPEVPADLADRVDDVRAHLLRDLRKLLV